MIIEPDELYFIDGQYVWTPERRAAAWDECFRRLEAVLQSRPVRKLILLVGIPGSGKSTYARAHDEDDVVVFDGYFGNPGRRARALGIANTHNVPVEGIWIDTPFERCVAQNAPRPPDRRVPVEAMQEMYDEVLRHPPTLAEGFVRVERVSRI
jgi:predicted kinase